MIILIHPSWKKPEYSNEVKIYNMGLLHQLYFYMQQSHIKYENG